MEALDVTRDLTRVLGERTLLRWELRGLKRALAALPVLEPLWNRVVNDWSETKRACAEKADALMFLSIYPLHAAEDQGPVRLPLTLSCEKGTARGAYQTYERSHAKYAKAYERANQILMLIQQCQTDLQLNRKTIRALRKKGGPRQIDVAADQKVWLWLCPEGIKGDQIEIYFCNEMKETVGITTVPLVKLLKKLKRLPQPKRPMRMACLFVTQIHLCSFSDGHLTATPIEHWDTLKELKQTLRK